jgi:hypothetical protein
MEQAAPYVEESCFHCLTDGGELLMCDAKVGGFPCPKVYHMGVKSDCLRIKAAPKGQLRVVNIERRLTALLCLSVCSTVCLTRMDVVKFPRAFTLNSNDWYVHGLRVRVEHSCARVRVVLHPSTTQMVLSMAHVRRLWQARVGAVHGLPRFMVLD